MPKKKKLQSTAPVMTRGQLSKAAQEAKRIRNLYTAGVTLGVLVVLVLGFAVLFTYLIRPNQEVAKVNNVSINRDAYNKLRKWGLFQQIQQQVFQSQISGVSGVDATLTGLQTQLKNVENESTLDSTVLQTLVDAEVLRQKSTQELSINPTNEQLLEKALKDFVPQPTPPPSSVTPSPVPSSTPTSPFTSTPTSTGTQSPTSTRTFTVTPTPGSPTMTPTPTSTFPPVPGASATATVGFGQFLNSIKGGTGQDAQNLYCPYGCPGFSESDYMKYIIEPQLRQDLATEQLSAGKVLTDVEQVRVQHILTATLEGAQVIRTRLDNGEDFGKLVLEQSSDTASAGQLGIYDWFPREDSGYVEPFAAASFTTAVGQYSQPVQTDFGYHIIKVLGKEVRPLTQSQLDTKRSQLYTDWFNAAKLASTISPASFMAPTPTSPPLVEPTIATTPAPTEPAGDATPAATNTTTGGSTPPAGATATSSDAARNTPEPSSTP